MTSAGIPATVEVTAAASCPPEVAAAVYLCCLHALEHCAGGARASVTVRDEPGELAFEIVGNGSGAASELDVLRDRVEALGGRLAIRSEPGAGTRVSGSIPLAR